MNKKAILITVLLIVAIFLAVAVPAYAGSANKKLIRLTVNNKSDETVKLWLTGDKYYYLTIKPESKVRFTVERDVYARTTEACGATAAGTLDMSSNVKLVFIECERYAPNQGAPTMEKVSLYDSPTGIKWRYQDY